MTAVKTKQPKKLQPHETDKFINDIVEAIQNNEIIRAKLFIARVGTMRKTDQSKVLRGIFNYFLLKNNLFAWTFQRKLREEHGIMYWSTGIETFQVVFIERLILSLKELEEQGKFEPRKIFTIPRINKNILSIDPELFDYLFKSGILVLGAKFKIVNPKSTIFKTTYQMAPWLTAANNVITQKSALESYQVDILNYMDPFRKSTIKIHNYMQNIRTLVGLVKENNFILLSEVQNSIDNEKNDILAGPDPILKARGYKVPKLNDQLKRNLNLSSEDKIYEANEQLQTRFDLYKKLTDLQSLILDRIGNTISNELTEVKCDFDPSKETFR